MLTFITLDFPSTIQRALLVFLLGGTLVHAQLPPTPLPPDLGGGFQIPIEVRATVPDIFTVINPPAGVTEAQWTDAAARVADSFANLATSVQIALVETARGKLVSAIGEKIGERMPGPIGDAAVKFATEPIEKLAASLDAQARSGRTELGVDTQFKAVVDGAIGDLKDAIRSHIGQQNPAAMAGINQALDKATASIVGAAGPSMRLGTIFRDVAAVSAAVGNSLNLTILDAQGRAPNANPNTSVVVVKVPSLNSHSQQIVVPSYGNGSTSGGVRTGGGTTQTSTSNSTPTYTHITYHNESRTNYTIVTYQPAGSGGGGGGGFYPSSYSGGVELAPAMCGLLKAAMFQMACLFQQEPGKPVEERTAPPTGKRSATRTNAPVTAPPSPDSPAFWHLPGQIGGAPAVSCQPAATVIHPEATMRSFEYSRAAGKEPATLVFAADSTRTGRPYEGAIATCTMTTNGVRLRNIEATNGILIYEFEPPDGKPGGSFYGVQWLAEIGPRAVAISNPVIPEDRKIAEGVRLVTYQVHAPTAASCLVPLEAFLAEMARSGRKVTLKREEAPRFFIRDARMDGTRLEVEVFSAGASPIEGRITLRMWPKTYDPARPASVVYALPIAGGVNKCVFRMPLTPGACSVELGAGSGRSLVFLQREVVAVNDRTRLSEVVGTTREVPGSLPLLGAWRGLEVSGVRPAVFFPFASTKRRHLEVSNYESLEIDGKSAEPLRLSVQFVRSVDDIGDVAKADWQGELAAGAAVLSVPLGGRSGAAGEFLGVVLRLDSVRSGSPVAAAISGLRLLARASGTGDRGLGPLTNAGMSVALPVEWSAATVAFTPLMAGKTPAFFLAQRMPARLDESVAGMQVAVHGFGESREGPAVSVPARVPVTKAWDTRGETRLNQAAVSGGSTIIRPAVAAGNVSVSQVWFRATPPVIARLKGGEPIRLLFKETPVRAFQIGMSELDPISDVKPPPGARGREQHLGGLPLAVLPAPDKAEMLVDFSTARNAVGTIGPEGRSRVGVIPGEPGDADRGARLSVTANPGSEAGAFGGAYVKLAAIAGKAVAFTARDVLRFDLRNMGDTPLDLAVELKAPRTTVAYLTVRAAAKPGHDWVKQEIPLSQADAGIAQPCQEICFVVTARCRFEIDNIRVQRAEP